MSSNSAKTPDYRRLVHGIWPKTEKFDFGKKMIPSERASQGEQNDANISFIAPSSEE